MNKPGPRFNAAEIIAIIGTVIRKRNNNFPPCLKPFFLGEIPLASEMTGARSGNPLL
jgi:hypothetical protein